MHAMLTLRVTVQSFVAAQPCRSFGEKTHLSGQGGVHVYISIARTASRPASTTECYTGTENNIDERARYCPGTNAAIMISKAKKTE